MINGLPNEWYEEHDGQRLVLNSDKVAAEIERQKREIQRLEDAIAMWRKHAYEVGRLLNADPGQGAKV
jgi:hypothetical protein